MRFALGCKNNKTPPTEERGQKALWWHKEFQGILYYWLFWLFSISHLFFFLESHQYVVSTPSITFYKRLSKSVRRRTTQLRPHTEAMILSHIEWVGRGTFAFFLVRGVTGKRVETKC